MIAEQAKLRGEGEGVVEGPGGRRGDRPEPKRLGGLVLARQLGESIMIGDSVLVEVLGLKSNAVRLRVVAPRSIAVHRREVFDAIRLAPDPEGSRSSAGESLAVLTGPAVATTDGGLVLTRRAGQTIMIGDAVAIDVVEARPGTVRLRVIAPREVRVHRREVYDAIRAGEPKPRPVGLAAEVG